MKNITPILAGTVLLTLLSACNKTEGPGRVPDSPGAKAISFQACIPSTKAGGDGSSASYLNDFGVFAYHTQGLWSESAQPNFMFNQKVTGNGSGTYSYSPVKYWPGGDSDYVTFFAYAPYATAANGISILTSNNSAGAPKIKYTVPVNEANQIDLLCATPEENLGPADGKVHFNFSHALSRIGLHAHIGTQGWNFQESNIYINEVTVSAKFPSSGALDLGDGTWSEVSAGTVRNYTRSFGNGDKGFCLAMNRQRLDDGSGYIMVIPADNVEVTIQVRYTVVTLDAALPGGKLSNEYNCTNKRTVTFSQGKSFEFALVANPSAISFAAPDILDWVEASGGTETIPFS